MRCRHLAQRHHCFLRTRLLDVAHDCVEQHDGENRHRFVGQSCCALVKPQSSRDQGRDEQQYHQNVLKLREELSPGRHRLFGRQLISTVTLEPCPRLRIAQSELRVRAERSQYFVDRLPVRGYIIIVRSLPGIRRFFSHRIHKYVVTTEHRKGTKVRMMCCLKLRALRSVLFCRSRCSVTPSRSSSSRAAGPSAPAPTHARSRSRSVRRPNRIKPRRNPVVRA